MTITEMQLEILSIKTKLASPMVGLIEGQGLLIALLALQDSLVAALLEERLAA